MELRRIISFKRCQLQSSLFNKILMWKMKYESEKGGERFNCLSDILKKSNNT